MTKLKIYASVAARVVILIVLFALLLPFFLLYVVSIISEAYLTMVGKYVADTKAAFVDYDKKLNG